MKTLAVLKRTPACSLSNLNITSPAVMSNHWEIAGNIVDLVAGRIRSGRVVIDGSTIAAIEYDDVPRDNYLIPGFVDAHVHIESSMLVPTEFARLATPHGT